MEDGICCDDGLHCCAKGQKCSTDGQCSSSSNQYFVCFIFIIYYLLFYLL
jgi:hypothetical protein